MIAEVGLSAKTRTFPLITHCDIAAAWSLELLARRAPYFAADWMGLDRFPSKLREIADAIQGFEGGAER